ncbi:hypothetical protein Q1695_005203 [Nippostrongylus brasiliensis]|nr:hypothetical protein Q1695_005203 [Nippostrongylus brasiliensis]
MIQKNKRLRKRPSRSAAPNIEGEKPVDLIAHFARLSAKQRQLMFSQVTATSRINCKTFLENRAQSRVPAPLHEKKRVMLTVVKEGETDYIPATYACCERDDYVLLQAPRKSDYRNYWRMVWRDGCKICVSLSNNLSESDDNLCYPYWPTKEGETMDIEDSRFVIECVKKQEMKGFSIYDLKVAGKDPTLDIASSKTITFMHFDAWPPDTWPDLDLLGPFVSNLSKREVQIMRKTTDNYIPPVVIQSHDGLGRAPIVWVATILMKEIEKKECFDVEDLAKKCARSRPGAFYKSINFCVLMALAYRLASLGGWIALADARKKMKDIEDAYQESIKK